MLKNSPEPFVVWRLLPRELAVWLIVLIATGFLALAFHGSSGSPGSEVHVLRLESQGGAATVSGAASGSSWRLDLNSATQSDLELLPGIGPRRAEAILRERVKRGGFQSVWQLSEISGLTPALVRRLEPLLRVSLLPR